MAKTVWTCRRCGRELAAVKPAVLSVDRDNVQRLRIYHRLSTVHIVCRGCGKPLVFRVHQPEIEWEPSAA